MRIHGGGNHKIRIPGESLAPISLFELSALLLLYGIGPYNPEYNLQFASPLYIFNTPSRDLIFHQNSPHALPPFLFLLANQPSPCELFSSQLLTTILANRTLFTATKQQKKTSIRRACCLLGSKVSCCPRHTTKAAVTSHISLLTLPCLTLPCSF